MDLPHNAFCLNTNSDMAVSFDEWFRPKVDSLSGIVDLDSVMMKTGTISGSGSVGGVDVLDHATQNLSEFEGFLLNERDHRPSSGIVGSGDHSAPHQLDDLDNSDILLQGKEHDMQVDKVCCDGGSNKLTFLDESLDLPRDMLTMKEEKIVSGVTTGMPMESLPKKDFGDKNGPKLCEEEDLCTFSILNYQIDTNISSLEESLDNSVNVATLKVNCDGLTDKSEVIGTELPKENKTKVTDCSVPFSPKHQDPKASCDERVVIAGESPTEDAQIVIRNVSGEPLFQGKISELITSAVNGVGGPVSSLVQSSCATEAANVKMPIRISVPNNVMPVLTIGGSTLTDAVEHAKSAKESIQVCSDSAKLKVGANPPEEADLEMAEEQDVEEETSDVGNGKGLRRVTEDGPVTEALAELGITTDSILYTISGVAGNAGGKIWVCLAEGCNKSFPRLSMLKIHILGHYGVRPYKCDYDGCHWSFYTYFKLKRHKETHLKKKDYLCPVEGCGRRFTTIYNLHTHEKLHWRPAEMVCPVKSCGACFQTRRHLEVHLRDHDVHHAPYRCPYADCGKHYYSANSLQSHIKSHQHKEEEVRCSWEGCGKLFDKPCRLRAHMRTHTGDKPYPCLFQGCGARFSTASKLKRHQHKHTNNRRFKCGEEGCMKSFLRSEHLKEHLLKHAGVGSFHCPIQNCKVKFTAKSSLYVHLKKHKGGLNSSNAPSSNADVASSQVPSVAVEKEKQSLWQCPVEGCNRKYVNKSSLRQHLLKAHVLVLGDGHPMMLMTNSVDELGMSSEVVEGNGSSSSHDLRNSYIVMGLPSGLEEEVAVITESSFVHSTVTPLNELLSTRPNGEVGSELPQVLENQDLSSFGIGDKGEALVSGGGFVDQEGSARTRYTLTDVVREREVRRKQNHLGEEPGCMVGAVGSLGEEEDNNCQLESARDSIMGAGSSSILGVPSKDIVLPQESSPCLLLQDDLPETLFRVSGSMDGTVHREGVISVGDVDGLDVSVSGVGGQNTSQLDPHQVLVPGVLSAAGFQVLLLSPPSMDSPRNHDFPPESTINLRDLE